MDWDPTGYMANGNTYTFECKYDNGVDAKYPISINTLHITLLPKCGSKYAMQTGMASN